MTTQSQWLSVYIFHELSFEKVLIELVKPLIDQLESHSTLLGYFFIRYWENGPHIRLRILPKNEGINHELAQIVAMAAEIYFQKINSPYHMEFNEYLRELNRYGGEHNIQIAEKNFEISSKTVINLINDNYEQWDYSLAIAVSIQMHVTLAKSLFNEDKENAGNLFKSIYLNWLYYSVKLDENNEVSEHEINKVKIFFENSYQKQKNKIHRIVKSVIEGDINDELYNGLSTAYKNIPAIIPNPDYDEKELYSIYDSLIHMTNNRLGIHLRDESYIAYIIFKSIEDMLP